MEYMFLGLSRVKIPLDNNFLVNFSIATNDECKTRMKLAHRRIKRRLYNKKIAILFVSKESRTSTLLIRLQSPVSSVSFDDNWQQKHKHVKREIQLFKLDIYTFSYRWQH